MTAEGNHLRYGLPLAREILERLRLEGMVADRSTSEVLIAFDPAVGWARTVDRWFVLGEAAPTGRPLPSASELMRDVAAWIDRQLGEASG